MLYACICVMAACVTFSFPQRPRMKVKAIQTGSELYLYDDYYHAKVERNWSTNIQTHAKVKVFLGNQESSSHFPWVILTFWVVSESSVCTDLSHPWSIVERCARKWTQQTAFSVDLVTFSQGQGHYNWNCCMVGYATATCWCISGTDLLRQY